MSWSDLETRALLELPGDVLLRKRDLFGGHGRKSLVTRVQRIRSRDHQTTDLDVFMGFSHPMLEKPTILRENIFGVTGPLFPFASNQQANPNWRIKLTITAAESPESPEN